MDASESPNTMASPESEPATTSTQPVDRTDVRERLDRVDDPELDRSIVELQYVERIDIDDDAVTVEFVLPTAWCSPAFAWMMATGIRDEVEALPDVSSVTVRLSDHMHGPEITAGVNQGQAFESVFDDANDSIDDVRRKLDRKARFARQYTAVRALRQAGLDAAQVAGLTWGDVDLSFGSDRAAVSVQDDALTVTLDREPIAEYLAKARKTGVVTDEADSLFADREGDPLEPDQPAVERVQRAARLAASNIEGQATICASLHESRNGVSPDAFSAPDDAD